MGPPVNLPSGFSVGSFAGPSADPPVDPIGASNVVVVQALVHTEPVVAAATAKSSLEIDNFSSQAWDALEESLHSIGSFSESPSILRNVDSSNVGHINIEGINTEVIDEGNSNESIGIINNESNNLECSDNLNESNSIESEMLDPNSKSVEADSNNEVGSEGCSMDLDVRAPS